MNNSEPIEIVSQYRHKLAAPNNYQELHEWTDEEESMALDISWDVYVTFFNRKNAPPLAVLAGLRAYYAAEAEIKNYSRRGKVAENVLDDIEKLIIT